MREKNTRTIGLLLLTIVLFSSFLPVLAEMKPRLIYREKNISGTLAQGGSKDHGPYEGVISVSVKITDLWVENPSPPDQPWLKVYVYKWENGAGELLGWEILGEGESTPWYSTNGGIGQTIRVTVENIYGSYDEDYWYTGKVRMYIN